MLYMVAPGILNQHALGGFAAKWLQLDANELSHRQIQRRRACGVCIGFRTRGTDSAGTVVSASPVAATQPVRSGADPMPRAPRYTYLPHF